jgi:hypothetical protein
MSPMETIPDFIVQKQHGPFGIDLDAITGLTDQPNTDYFRELANFEFARRLFRSIRLLVKNVGQVAANNVQCEMEIPAGIGVHVMSDLPVKPEKQLSFIKESVLKDIKPAFRREPGDVTIDKNNYRYRIEIDCGDLQPGRRVWSDVFYLGKRDSGNIDLLGKIYAANLPKPKDFTLKVNFNVTKTIMTVSELKRLRDSME